MNGDWKNGKRTTEKKIKPMALFLLHNITINDACRLVVVHNTYICQIYFFRQITTFLKVRVAFVFGLQTL